MDLPLSNAIKAGDLVFISGIPPIENGTVHAPDDIIAQTQFVLDRMDSLLQQFGLSLENLTYVQVYLRTLDDYAVMNQVYASRIPLPYPARKVVPTMLPKEHVLVEMSGTASCHMKQAL